MKHILFTFVLLAVLSPIGATMQAELDSLDSYIARESEFDCLKEQHIASLISALDTAQDRYLIYDRLFEEYKSYNFDKAVIYVDKLYDEAILQGDTDRIIHARVQKGFAYLSAGLFKEGADLFEDMDTTGASVETHRYYCITYARLLYDMADYDHVGMTHTYNLEGNRLLEEALTYLNPSDTADYWYCMATRDAKEGKNRLAIERLALSLLDSRISEHQKAINYSTLAYLHHNMGEDDQRQHYNILAAISDLKSSTKETVAMRNVAEVLYTEGDIGRAGRYIRHAMDDANFYNARHRQLEISQILPIIEQQNIQVELHQKRLLYLLAAVALVLLVMLMMGLLILVNRLHALRAARMTIQQMNESLREMGHIKEEYIGNLLCSQSALLGEMERYQQFVQKNASEKRYAELLAVPRQFNAPKKRDEFYQRFDEMFLHIFPNFVADFNALLLPEQQIVLKEGELLNTDLRIAALLRLGISHNEIIAQVLDYSVNTIYAYKTRMRGKTALSPEQFHARIMAL